MNKQELLNKSIVHNVDLYALKHTLYIDSRLVNSKLIEIALSKEILLIDIFQIKELITEADDLLLSSNKSDIHNIAIYILDLCEQRLNTIKRKELL